MLQSPCINVCKMDATSQLCIGCFRTLEEITVWARTDDAHRTRILAAVAERRAELAPPAGKLRGDKP